MKTELLFLVEEDPDGGWVAEAHGEAIVTYGPTLEELRENIREAVSVHFDEGEGPAFIRLHIVRQEVLAS